ncbi:MAG: hypothetical protein ACPGXY_05590 [Alphaproteobacteria bacterium]
MTDSLPITVDLDGTLIFNEISFFTLIKYLKQKPWGVFMVMYWWIRGFNPYVKQQLAKSATFDPSELDFNEPLLMSLGTLHSQGRKLLLVTGADQAHADLIAHHAGIFSGAHGSNGKVNLIGKNKAAFLSETFGRKGFIYYGNSWQDVKVWEAAASGVAVNAPDALKAYVKHKFPHVEVFSGQ